MLSTATDKVLIESRANDFAYRVGQMVEDLLVESGIELAGKAGSRMVTIEHLKACLDRVLPARLVEQLRECSHDGIEGECNVARGVSRDAA